VLRLNFLLWIKGTITPKTRKPASSVIIVMLKVLSGVVLGWFQIFWGLCGFYWKIQPHL